MTRRPTHELLDTVPVPVGPVGNPSRPRRKNIYVPPPPTTAQKKGLMVLNFGGAPYTDTTRYPYISVLVLGADQDVNRTTYRNWRAGTQPPFGRLVFYKTMSETASAFGVTPFSSVTAQQTVAQTNRFVNTALVPAEEVKWHDENFPADQWMLYNESGNPLFYGGFSQSWLVDVAKPTYQELAYQYARGQIIAQGWDGIYFDNILISTAAGFPYYRKNSLGQLVVAYPDPAAWSNGMVAGLQGIAARLKADGYPVITNTHWFVAGEAGSNTGSSVIAWWQRVAPNVSVMLAEYGPVPSTNLHRSMDDIAWYDYWLNWTNGLYNAAVGGGAGISFGSGVDAPLSDRQFSVASWLVNWDGQADAMANVFGTNAWFDSLDKRDWAGQILGGLFQSNNIRARRYSWGWAAVNTTRAGSRSATFTDPVTGLPRTFNLAAVDSYVGA